MYIDVHAHLDHQRYRDDLDSVIQSCRKNHVQVITCGVNKESNRRVLEISKTYPDVVNAALGMYPLDIIGMNRDDSYSGTIPSSFLVDEELTFISKQKAHIIAISEVGLDKSIETPCIDQQ